MLIFIKKNDGVRVPKNPDTSSSNLGLPTYELEIGNIKRLEKTWNILDVNVRDDIS